METARSYEPASVRVAKSLQQGAQRVATKRLLQIRAHWTSTHDLQETQRISWDSKPDASRATKYMHQPGIEPGSHRWQRCILPLDH